MAQPLEPTLPLFDSPADNLDDSRPRLLMLMDGHAMVHRSFHAISAQGNLTVSATGEDVTGVLGFTNVFLKALNDWNPTYCAIAFDTRAPTFRHLRFQDYKAQRPPTPVELRPQFDRVKQLMTAFGVPVFELDGYEGDDLIGTLAHRAEDQGVETIILTGDRDTFQLITPLVRVDLHSVRDRKVYDEEELQARYSGLTAVQQPDFKALLGDTSDNIPGVPRVGEKRAIGLLNDYQNLEGIYENLDGVTPPSVKESLAENRERAFENRILTTIDREAPVNLDLDASRFGEYDHQVVVDLMTELEFYSVIPRLPIMKSGTAGGASSINARPAGAGPSAEVEYQAVQTEEQLQAMLAALQENAGFSFDTETTSLDAMQADLVGLSFSISPNRAWYVPVGHKEGQQLPMEHVLTQIRPLMESKDLAKCAHNANYDVTILANHGIYCRNVDFDTMIAAHLLGKPQLGLKTLSQAVLGREMTPISKLIGTGRKQITFDRVEIEPAAQYAAADADITGQLRDSFEGPVKDQELGHLLNDMEMPLMPVLVTMQRHGIKMDAGVLHEMSRDLNEQMHNVEMELYSSIGHRVNINSPQQLSDLLFKELGLPHSKRTKTGYSTDANSLEGLKGVHPAVDNILEYRQISKLKSTYVDTLPELINPRTGRIHTSYNQTGSATGRISSSDPNLQNIPIRTEAGRQVRRAFMAEEAPDWVLFSADYSQIELRVLAHMSQDPELLDAFRRGEDIHSSTASLMFDVPVNRVTSDQRRIAKVLNFGVIYGLSAHGIAQQTEFSREEGANFIENYFVRYPGISGYLEDVKAKTRGAQYVETLLGRRRYVPEINASNFNVRGAAERMAINMPIQGTAADIMKLAMIRVQRRLDQGDLRTKMLLQVHDELVFESPREELDAIQALVFDEMPAALDQYVNLDVSLKVDVKWAETWGDME